MIIVRHSPDKPLGRCLFQAPALSQSRIRLVVGRALALPSGPWPGKHPIKNENVVSSQQWFLAAHLIIGGIEN